MSDQIPTKKSFGSVRVDRFSPPKEAEWPKAINVHISFEEAMRLHLGLSQILGKLNSYDRSTKRGRETAVNLCVYPQAKRITINEGTVKNGED
jgi:hypothetical protein